LLNMAAWFLWGCSLVWARYAIAVREQQVEESVALNVVEA